MRAAVGVLTEQHGLYGRMPAGEYLDFFGQIYGMDAQTRRSRAQKLLEDFGLLDYHGATHLPNTRKACAKSWRWRGP